MHAFLQVQDGVATLNLQLEKIHSKVMEQLNQTLSDLLERGSQLYVGVFVTNIQSKKNAFLHSIYVNSHFFHALYNIPYRFWCIFITA